MATAQEIIDDVQDQLGDPSGDLFTQALCVKWLNRSLKHISDRTRSIIRSEYTAKVANQEEYALPANFLQVQILLFYDGSQWYPLRLTRYNDIQTHRYYTQSTNRPYAYSVKGNTHAVRVSGTATGGSATTLDDTAKTFNAGADKVYIGDRVLNTTDDSEAVVTTVAATKLTFSAGLGGGSDDTFAVSDAYKVLSKSAYLKALTIHPAPSVSDTAGTESIRGVFSFRHRLITQDDIDNSNDELEIDVDLEESVIFQMQFFARDYEGDEQAKATAYQYFQAEFRESRSRVKRKNMEFLSRWRTEFFSYNNIRFTGTLPTRTLPDWY